ncbi:hypothetical protein ABC795_04265 [Blastococcus sp. HT6-30]|uniref:hypothetical protein n=1 Tax=Blastococcus sp. HT6-30 TaxID=3144843 RepID=UPI00321966F1
MAASPAWDLTPETVGAIGGAVGAILTGIGIIIAARQYRSTILDRQMEQASKVSLYRIWQNEEPLIVNATLLNASDRPISQVAFVALSRDSNPFDFTDQAEIYSMGSHHSFLRQTRLSYARIEELYRVDPGAHDIRIPFTASGRPGRPWSTVGVSFVDANGRSWTRRLDGELLLGLQLE